MGIFELEMRPGKQLFPLNYNNIKGNVDIKNNIKAIKLIIRETYGGNRTYINQIMFYEQNAEQVKDLICGNELKNIYKNQKKLIENYSNSQLSQKFNHNNSFGNIKKSKYSEDLIKNLNEEYMNQYYTQNNNSKIKKNKIQKKNAQKYFTEIKNDKNMFKEQDEIFDIDNNDEENTKNKEEVNEEFKKLNERKKIPNNAKYHKINNKKKQNKKKFIEITPLTTNNTKTLKSEIKQDINKVFKKETLQKNTNESLTPNKYLKRVKSLTNNNNTLNITPNLNINLSKKIAIVQNKNEILEDNNNIENNDEKMFISSNRNDIYNNQISSSTNNFYVNYLPDEKNEKYQTYEERMYDNTNNFNSMYSGNGFSSSSINKSKQLINNINNNNLKNYENEENPNILGLGENKEKMYNTHKNMNYHNRNNWTGVNNMKKNPLFITNNHSQNASIYSNQNEKENNEKYENEQNKEYEDNFINNNNISQRKNNIGNYNINSTNNSQRFSVRSNYENIKSSNIKRIKERLDYLEANIIEFKKEINLISESLSNFNSKEFLINNFKAQILDICEEIYNENFYNQKNISIISNSNIDSQNKKNDFILDNEINRKIDERFGNIKNNLFDKFLQPKLEEIGNSVKKNIDKIKSKVDNIGNSIGKQKYNFEKSEGSYPYIPNEENDEMIFKSSSKLRNEKFDEINRINENLYNKLLEKEKKLKLLKLEKTKFLIEENEKDNIDVEINY